MCLYRKMASIQELDLRVRYVFSKCLGPGRDEKRVVLTPNCKQGWVRLPEVVLKRRIKLYVRCIIAK